MPDSPLSQDSPRGWHSRGYLPHFDSDLHIQHVTFHLADSMPAATLEQLNEELQQYDPDRRDVERRKRLDQLVDAGHGSCILKRPGCARIIESALWHFDGDRYRLLEWVVMPNHVHVLFQPLDGWSLGRIVGGWKTYTANEILKVLRKEGREFGSVWRREYWDRYIRDANHYEAVVGYIRNNPVTAGLVVRAED